MYRYLLWDIDGTVLDFSASEACAIKALFQSYGLGACSDEMVQLYSRINQSYWERLEKKELTKQEILLGRFIEFFGQVGVDTAIVESFNRDYQLTLGDYIVFTPHAQEVLAQQQGRYVLIAVTNGTKIAQTKKMKKSGLDGVFDGIFISEDVGADKPHKAYFDFVFSAMGITDKSQVLLIGDSLSSDMQGGYMAGVDTCWYNPSGKPNSTDIPMTYEIRDLRQLANLLT